MIQEKSAISLNFHIMRKLRNRKFQNRTSKISEKIQKLSKVLMLVHQKIGKNQLITMVTIKIQNCDYRAFNKICDFFLALWGMTSADPINITQNEV